MPAKRKRRRRKKGYHRGLYTSPIAGECKFRSSWEEKYMHHLDADPDVASWSYEKLIIEYVSNQRTGKVRKYFPDFFIEMKDGSRMVVEIKQRRKLDNVIVKKKTAAATAWCSAHEATFKILTEIELRQLGIIGTGFTRGHSGVIIGHIMPHLILGLDVSTSTTGVCLLDAEKEPDSIGSHILYIDRIEYKKQKTLWEKADHTARCLEDLKKLFPGDYQLALEEPLLGFRTGMSSAGTITTLMRFNGIVSYIGRKTFDVDPRYISSSTARKSCGIKVLRTSVAGMSGKEQVFKYMSENDLKHVVWPLKKNGQPVDWSRDATDAYVIARSAMVLKE